MSSDPVITLRDVTFSYGGEPTLQDVNLSIHDREAVCIVGPNGGGKTTLVKLILGLLEPHRGEVRVFGQPPSRSRLRIGYMPQHLHFDARFPVTVMDIVLMGRLGQEGRAATVSTARRTDILVCPETTGRNACPPETTGRNACSSDGPRWQRLLRAATGWPSRADHQAAIDALRQVDMEEFRRRSFASLSGGQRQRVLIARALAGNPDLLLFDEPTSNVDSAVEARLLDLLRELNRRMTIVMVSHDLGFVSDFVESVVCVNRRVVVHPTSAMTGEAIRDIYGGEVRMVRHDEFQHVSHSLDS